MVWTPAGERSGSLGSRSVRHGSGSDWAGYGQDRVSGPIAEISGCGQTLEVNTDRYVLGWDRAGARFYNLTATVQHLARSPRT
jgi:hypothetical protein